MLRRPSSRAVRTTATLAVIITAGMTLAACAPADSQVAPETSSPTVAATTAPSAEPTEDAPPVVHLDGTAEANLPVFTAVADQVWASAQKAEGRAYIDGLVAVGFDKSDMQVTQDLTTVGNPVESLEFSVRWGSDECLVGQVGPSTGQVVTAVMPQLAEGRCLIGETRTIDW